MVLSLRTGRMELSLREMEEMIRRSRVGRDIRSLAFEYIYLEMSIRNLRRHVQQAGGYDGPGWSYKLGSHQHRENLKMQCNHLGSECS